MKIVEKIVFCVNTERFLAYTNNTPHAIILPLFYAHSITGEFNGYTDGVPMKDDGSDDVAFDDPMRTRLLYDPYYAKNIHGKLYREPEFTEPEYDLRHINQPMDDNMRDSSPITIPPGVQRLSIIIDRGDTVIIDANYGITHVIIDDDGNEISIDEAIDKKITEKMLEIIK